MKEGLNTSFIEEAELAQSLEVHKISKIVTLEGPFPMVNCI